jgi:hypothetical protein
MLVWMSRKLIDVLVSLIEEIASKVGQFGMIFIRTPTTNLTQHNLYGQDDTQTTIDYHQLDLSRDVTTQFNALAASSNNCPVFFVMCMMKMMRVIG